MQNNEQLKECVVIASEQLTWAIKYIEDKHNFKAVKKEVEGALEELKKMRVLLRSGEMI